MGDGTPWAVKQKRAQYAASFAFERDCLRYTFSHVGRATERRIAWNEFMVPSGRTEAADLNWVWTSTVAILPILAAMISFNDPLPLPTALGGGAILAALSWIALLVGARWFAAGYCIVPTRGAGVVVLNDRNRAKIIAEIELRRREAIEDMVSRAKDLPWRAQLRTLRYAAEMDETFLPAFESRQRLLLPWVEQLLLRPVAVVDAPARLIVQRRLLAQASFEFTDRAIKCRRSVALAGRQEFNFRYGDLPVKPELLGSETPSRVQFVVCAWAGFVACAVVEAIMQGAAPDYYIGNPGFKHAAILFGPILAGYFGFTWAIYRACIIRWLRITAKLLMLRGAGCEDILAEMKARLFAALKRLAEPDPLRTPDEQKALLKWLETQEVITAAEAEAAFSRAVAVQGFLDLDRRDREEREMSEDRVLN